MPSLTRKLLELFNLDGSDDEGACRPAKRTRYESPEIEVEPPLDYFDYLPDDIHRLIFHFYLVGGGADQPFSPSSAHGPSLSSTLLSVASPFILGRVCKYWREISRATPSLWSSLIVYKPIYWQIPTIEHWLALSGDEPLSLHLCQPYPEETEGDATMPVLEMFAMLAERWKTISIASKQQLPPIFLSYIKEVPLKVESVELDCPPYNFSEHPWPMLYALPTLRRVSWTSTENMEELPSASWIQLTHIKLSVPPHISVEDLLLSLLYCENLVDLDISMTMPILIDRLQLASCSSSNARYGNSAVGRLRITAEHDRDTFLKYGVLPLKTPALTKWGVRLDSDHSSALRHPIEFPKLRRLKIHAYQRDAMPLVRYLTLPALSSLHILHYNNSSVPSSLSYLTALFSRSGGARHLTELSIYDPVLPEAELENFLKSLVQIPNLQELELLVNEVTDLTVELLKEPRDEGSIQRFPRLRCLRLPASYVTDGLLSNMVRSRSRMLKELTFSVPVDWHLPVDLRVLRKISTLYGLCLTAL